ncbi:MAG: hypothetical protein AAFN30_07650 [Actinomycetota bacterium]
MEFVLLAVAVIAVVAVALLFVGWAVGKTSVMPDQIVIEAEEAIEFCAEALPVEVTSVLSYDDLRRALRLHLEWVQFYHWSPEGESDGPVLFEEFDALDYVVERADAVGLDISRDHARAVIEAQSAYLQVVGAIHLEDPVQVEADLAEHPVLGRGSSNPLLDPGDSEAAD